MATTAATASGRRQFGVGTSRVRAASPQFRHQSWSSARCAPQRGQAVPRAGAGAVAVTRPGGRRAGRWPSAARRRCAGRRRGGRGAGRARAGCARGRRGRARSRRRRPPRARRTRAQGREAGSAGPVRATPWTPSPTSAAIVRAPVRARPHDGQKRASLPCSVPQRGHAVMPGSRSSVTSRFSPSASSRVRSSASTAASAATLPRTRSSFWRSNWCWSKTRPPRSRKPSSRTRRRKRRRRRSRPRLRKVGGGARRGRQARRPPGRRAGPRWAAPRRSAVPPRCLPADGSRAGAAVVAAGASYGNGAVARRLGSRV